MKKIVVFLMLIDNFIIAQCDTVKNYWEPGLIKAKGCLIEGKKEGFWIYYQNYMLSPIDSMGAYSNDKKQGQWIFYGNGPENLIIKKGEYIDDKKNGYWKELCFEGFYKDGLKEGLWVCHTAIDTNLVDKINYRNGKINGVAQGYYTNGSIRFVGYYCNGEPDKEFSKFSMNGKLMEKGQYKNGQKKGIWWNYDDLGTPISKGGFKNGAKIGLWLYYGENGSLTKEEHFDKKGKLQKTINYN